MVALVVSNLAVLVMAYGIVWYMNRRSVDDPMSWGESMLFATYVFWMMFLVFGIVPHQWLTLAENEWSFRADVLWDAWGLITAQSQGGWFPFEVTLRVLSDSIAAVIYIIYLVGMVVLWMRWQNRGKAAPSTEVATSTYGRPLVRRG